MEPVAESSWEFAALLHFYNTFRADLHLPTFTANEFESAVVYPHDNLLMAQLLGAVVPLKASRNVLRQSTVWTWIPALKEKVAERYKDFFDDNPLDDTTFFDLDIATRLKLMNALCQWKMNDSEQLQSSATKLGAPSLRPTPLGFDADEDAYFSFSDDCWIFRENVSYMRETKSKSKKKRGKNTYAFDKTEDERYAGVDKIQAKWDVMCNNLENMQELIDNLGKTKAVKPLAQTLRDMHEEFTATAAARLRASEKRARLQMMPRKRSSRIATKILEDQKREEEEKRLAEIRRQEEEAAAVRRKEEARLRAMERAKEQEERQKQLAEKRRLQEIKDREERRLRKERQALENQKRLERQREAREKRILEREAREQKEREARLARRGIGLPAASPSPSPSKKRSRETTDSVETSVQKKAKLEPVHSSGGSAPAHPPVSSVTMSTSSMSTTAPTPAPTGGTTPMVAFTSTPSVTTTPAAAATIPTSVPATIASNPISSPYPTQLPASSVPLTSMSLPLLRAQIQLQQQQQQMLHNAWLMQQALLQQQQQLQPMSLVTPPVVAHPNIPPQSIAPTQQSAIPVGTTSVSSAPFVPALLNTTIPSSSSISTTAIPSSSTTPSTISSSSSSFPPPSNPDHVNLPTSRTQTTTAPQTTVAPTPVISNNNFTSSKVQQMDVVAPANAVISTSSVASVPSPINTSTNVPSFSPQTANDSRPQ